MKSSQLQTHLGQLEKKLRELPHACRLAFAAACCERAYPNYVRFFQLVHWGGPGVLRASLDQTWEFIENPSLVLNDLDELEQKCEAVTPDLDDFGAPEIDVEAAAAQEAAFMVRLLLQLCRDNQVSYALRIANFAYDTVDMYVQTVEKIDPSDPRLDEKVGQHPLMRQEILKQAEDTSKLARIKTQAQLHQFRRYAGYPQQSNIGLPRPVDQSHRH